MHMPRLVSSLYVEFHVTERNASHRAVPLIATFHDVVVGVMAAGQYVKHLIDVSATMEPIGEMWRAADDIERHVECLTQLDVVFRAHEYLERNTACLLSSRGLRPGGGNSSGPAFACGHGRTMSIVRDGWCDN